MTVDWTLYLVTDARTHGGRSLPEVVAEAIEGGVTVVQYREKDAGGSAQYRDAILLREVTRRAGVPFIVNDRVDLALAVGADGVHVGKHDLPLAAVRRLAPGLLVGYSVETWDDLAVAESGGADYIGISAVFPTPTKGDVGTYWGLDGVRQVAARSRLPAVAIGGIDAGNAAAVLACGVRGICVVSAIIGAPDPGAAARNLLLAIGR